MLSNLTVRDANGPGPLRQGTAPANGAGVEIVLKLDGVDDVTALYEHFRSRTSAVEPLRPQPWGLYDFRLRDPDGYYRRVTHGDAAGAP
ncbi:hypothetical protein Ait01nite_034580 [Actinoplanes italicus]|uniref:Glyoxalase/fosfomycin resistance/dioxygenase domain-containing protein n=1 Tax=Actinoplanes italicus TaxID=113567 RepID=A0A2T0K924_9ACTN|nr:VOC family protein [Actinoplanes italicus]PRX19574.1 hypothetical protein CLV67_110326 [Actinoplanes italicus]GIE30413.1 hypothetical protein Ait01nite_034580 [Actinoplanes italicus]